MADKQFKTVSTKSTIVSADKVILIDSQDSDKLKQAPATAFVWPTWPTGIIYKWAYSGATAYVVNDVTTYNGSSYICILASTGNLPTNTTYWSVLAAKGTDGSGTWDALTSNPLSQFASTTSAQLKWVISDETWSGALVFWTSPNITTPTGIVKWDVGLWNVDNTSDATKNSAVATLTNKTMTGATNTITASLLKSATTEINVSSATAPTTGQVLTATSSTTATWQTPSTTDISCRVYQNSATAWTGNTWVSALFQLENFDTDTMHDTVTNTSRITIKTAGKYVFGGSVTINSNSVYALRILLNWTTEIHRTTTSWAPDNLTIWLSISWYYSFAVNDYIELQFYAVSAVNTSGSALTNFWATKN